MARLYRLFKHPSTGKKVYIPTVRGAHVLRAFHTATAAQSHAERLQARYDRLRKAARAPGQLA